jgi:hypothetical protein
VCNDDVRLSRAAPLDARTTPEAPESGLPFDYYFVGADGSFGYAKLALAEEGIPDAQLEPGFAVGIVHVARKTFGDPFGLTTKGLWLPMRDLHPAQPTSFRGADLEGVLDVAWVLDDDTRVYDGPSGKRLRDHELDRFVRVAVHETVKRGGRAWLRIDEERWVAERDVRRPRAAESPSALRPGERWIDVDTDQQVLTAYVGRSPVFATMVSTGKGPRSSTLATPLGEHRIWVKLRTSDMTNLENEEASRYYAMEEVPWVMYFQKGYGLHGAYWHRSFGHVRSHGCVNLSPADAAQLFAWTSPRLPAGWSAVLPTEHDPGTLIRVR